MRTVIDNLTGILRHDTGPRCFCGLDGFVDEVVHTVDRRIDADTYVRLETLSEYGKRISSASGLSLNVEIVPVSRKLGGNGPIFAQGLKRYGSQITYIGSVGVGVIDPVFEELADGSTVIGIADPGRTDAMEFADGKIIRSKLAALNDVTWENICKYVGREQFAGYMEQSDLISFNNWTMLPHMSSIWNHILEEIVPKMNPRNIARQVLFFDLADPEKRTPEDVMAALTLIQRFHACGFNTVLGLNRKEACEIAEVLGCRIRNYYDQPLRELNEFLAERLMLDCVTVHPIDCAACVYKGEYYCVEGPYCSNPRLTTGAGDNYNTGFVFGYLQGWNMEECLTLGVASSGYYVRNAHSADRNEILSFLELWNDGKLDHKEEVS